MRVKDSVKVLFAQKHNNSFQFLRSILTISVLRTHGYTNSPVKLDSCLHIRFSMSALKGKAAEQGANSVVSRCLGWGMLFAWLLVPTVFVNNLDVCGLAKLTAPTVAIRDVVWTELFNAVSSLNLYLLFMTLVFWD